LNQARGKGNDGKTNHEPDTQAGSLSRTLSAHKSTPLIRNTDISPLDLEMNDYFSVESGCGTVKERE